MCNVHLFFAKSSDINIATVSKNGVVKAKKAGSVTISVCALDGSNKQHEKKNSIFSNVKFEGDTMTIITSDGETYIYTRQ